MVFACPLFRIPRTYLLPALYFKAAYKMSIFVQKLNPITGMNDWVVQNEDYDYHQEVARSAFADMLHDTERNQLYEKALSKAINKMHAKGKRADVLDIGTGTGLLSMMAARNGADSITACEAFKPMSECALKIIELNGYKDKIKVIPKRSTSLVIGENGDLPDRCNILVTEVFDTELIGEGALSTFSHAHKHLLEKDCIVIPHSATIYAQIVESPFVQNWNKLKDIYNDDGEILIKVPPSITECSGSVAVHDVQLSQLPEDAVNTIISPVPVLRFDWSGKTPFVFERSTILSAKAETHGKAQAVFMWWDLQMDQDNELILSCAPQWAHPFVENKQEKIPWRDHWMQAIYYLPKELHVKKNQEVHIISCHDEYSLWFDLKDSLKIAETDLVNPQCTCGLHVSFSRTRIGQMNDTRRNKKYITSLEKYINRDSIVLVLSDGFHLSLAASKLGAKKIYYLETNNFTLKIFQEFSKHNNIDNVEIIDNLAVLKTMTDLKNVNLVFGEPYFVSSILPWDNLLYLYLLKGVRHFLTSSVEILPKIAAIRAIAVQFSDLHKIRCPLGVCEGFFMKPFDELIEESRTISDDNVEAQPLWEYPCIALSNVVDILRLDLINTPTDIFETSGTFNIERSLGCNGIALWVDWVHDEFSNGAITTGPVKTPEIGKKITWDVYTRQGVCLFPNTLRSQIDFTFVFDFNEGNITFKCNT